MQEKKQKPQKEPQDPKENDKKETTDTTQSDKQQFGGNGNKQRPMVQQNTGKGDTTTQADERLKGKPKEVWVTPQHTS